MGRELSFRAVPEERGGRHKRRRGFAELAAAKAAGQPDVSGISFKDMWQTRFPGAYYHVMDGHKISQGTWERLDFPHDDFFRNKVDKSILDWKPTGPEPKMTDSSVQSRAVSTLGKNQSLYRLHWKKK